MVATWAVLEVRIDHAELVISALTMVLSSAKSST
jgi:hypothetical protein